ncbi:MAG: hypothetical protein K1X94_03415 [Sandaracinaceae bacterium]|nr:hypothetical protein [Sandaracinaceae bacterium]
MAENAETPTTSPRAIDAPAPAADSTTPTGPTPASRLWWAIAAIGLIEILGQRVIESRVAPRDEWQEALAAVRAEWQPHDAVVVAPLWADPLLREAAGELVDRPMAGHSDLAAYARLWVVSIRGHRSSEAPEGAPELSHDYGRVRVERWSLPAPSVVYDLVEHVGEAHVTRRERGLDLPCRRLDAMGSTQGGLANGPIEGAPRHLCDPGRPWLWVGATTTMDLELRGRHCVSQHAQGSEPITTSYDDVPLGRAVVLHGGVWWERERWRNGGDVEVVVRLDGEEIGRMTHHDGDGWKRMEAAIPEARAGGRGRISVDVSAGDPEFRAFCWAASTRSGS